MALSSASSFDDCINAYLDMRADYSAAKQSQYSRRCKGLLSTSSNADWYYSVEAYYLRIMEIARDIDRNDAIVGQEVDRAADNAIQDGMQLDFNTGDDKINVDLMARWEDWPAIPTRWTSPATWTSATWSGWAPHRNGQTLP